MLATGALAMLGLLAMSAAVPFQADFTAVASLSTSDDPCGTAHKDQESCDADKTTGGGCTWCKCGALPSSCFSIANSKKLPAGVYICDSKAQMYSAAADVPLVTFDGSAATKHEFKMLNDPVMGGQSNGTFALGDNYAIVDGYVNIVPKLKAPGFIEAWADDGGYPDASGAANGELVLLVRSSTPEYDGFHVSFAADALSPMFACATGGSIIGGRGCFKTKFSVPKGDQFSEVVVPFTSFSDKWSPSTGEQTETCKSDKSVCPSASKLKHIQAIGIWGEGKAGHMHLEIKSISARPARTTKL